MDIVQIEYELKKRLNIPYVWGRKQSDIWDKYSSFIYKTQSFEQLLKRCNHFSDPLKNYTLNRWYNFLSAQAVEYLFCQHQHVIANKNPYDKLIDFSIEGVAFDHKTSVFPKAYQNTISYAQNHELDLIQWLYKNQSQEGRKHLKNRLFIVLYDSEKQDHWKLKSEILLIKKQIDLYINTFSMDKLYKFDPGEGMIYSAIIWVKK